MSAARSGLGSRTGSKRLSILQPREAAQGSATARSPPTQEKVPDGALPLSPPLARKLRNTENLLLERDAEVGVQGRETEKPTPPHPTPLVKQVSGSKGLRAKTGFVLLSDTY